jgi:hypothetical protein
MMDDLRFMTGRRQNGLEFIEDEQLLTSDRLLPLCREAHELASIFIKPNNTFIGVGLFFENRQEARKLGLLPKGKSFEAGCERLKPQERKERVFKGQPDTDDFNCIFRVKTRKTAQSKGP